MRRIVAIGGGEIGRQGKPVETLEIDRELVALADRRRPRLLFIPTASRDSEAYVEAVERHFGGRLGCAVEALLLIGRRISAEEIRGRIVEADIIYVGGGDTLSMMRTWRRLGVDAALREAAQRGIVMSGLSAGANCWFRHGVSGGKPGGRAAKRVTGLGLLPALCCPHWDAEDRSGLLDRMMRRTPGVAVALDSCCAIEVVGDEYRILASRKAANAYRLVRRRGVLERQRLEKSAGFRPLSELLGGPTGGGLK
jgi:dipeptidase E